MIAEIEKSGLLPPDQLRLNHVRASFEDFAWSSKFSVALCVSTFAFSSRSIFQPCEAILIASSKENTEVQIRGPNLHSGSR